MNVTRTETIVIGAGQAGLAMSSCLTERAATTSCSNAAGWPSAGAPSAGSRFAS